MSVITHVTNQCDKCGFKDTNKGEGHYNLPGWASIRVQSNVFHRPWKLDEISDSSHYCPTCVTEVGRLELTILSARTMGAK